MQLSFYAALDRGRSWGVNKQMFLFYSSMGLAIFSIILYHVCQKLTPTSVNPLLSLTVTFATATFTCVVLFLLYPSGVGLRDSVRQLNWASIALAFTVVGTDAGFLLAYRAGWNITIGALVSNVVVTMMLVPIGLLFFKEHMSVMNIVGIVVCIGGLVLIDQG